LSDELLSCDTT